MTTKVYEFDENNSGGSWWLNRKQYEALFKAGWTYKPSEWDLEHGHESEPFLNEEGDTVPYGWRHNLKGEFNSIDEAIDNFEEATNENYHAEGCPCCGPPFNIHEEW